MFEKVYPFRFQLFLISLLAVLFGILLFPDNLYESILSPIILISNLISGIILISKKKKIMYFFIILLLFASVDLGSKLLNFGEVEALKYISLAVYFLFYLVVTFELIYQVWNSKLIDINVIYGVISGYLSLGLIAFFICLSIEMFEPGSFNGIALMDGDHELISDSIMYYSYITLLTIGYGDIVPITQVARKTSILIGLMGQFYMVIITAIIVGKYISQTARK